jgi:hypothetical protein
MNKTIMLITSSVLMMTVALGGTSMTADGWLAHLLSGQPFLHDEILLALSRLTFPSSMHSGTGIVSMPEKNSIHYN